VKLFKQGEREAGYEKERARSPKNILNDKIWGTRTKSGQTQKAGDSKSLAVFMHQSKMEKKRGPKETMWSKEPHVIQIQYL